MSHMSFVDFKVNIGHVQYLRQSHCRLMVHWCHEGRVYIFRAPQSMSCGVIE